MKPWFQDRQDDPELILLKVRVDEADYWDAPGSGVNGFTVWSKAQPRAIPMRWETIGMCTVRRCGINAAFGLDFHLFSSLGSGVAEKRPRRLTPKVAGQASAA